MKHPHTPENRLRTATVSRMCAVLANMVLVGSVVLTCVSTWGLTACASSQGSSTAAGAAASSAVKESAPQNAKALVLGEISWDEWKRKAGWAAYKDENFKPIPAILQRIEEDLNADKTISFLIFSATWCDDAAVEMPRLFQVLEGANVTKDRIKIIGVNEQKIDPTGSAERFGVALVPTIVVMKNGKENGRISEHPRTSWELDLIVVIER